MESGHARADRQRQAEDERQAAERAKVVAFRRPLAKGGLKKLAESVDDEPVFVPEE
jgi:hypothetical protein